MEQQISTKKVKVTFSVFMTYCFECVKTEMSVKTVVSVVNRGDYYDVIEIKKPEE